MSNISFGEQDDEFLTLTLKELIEHKNAICMYDTIISILPDFSNYELNAGFIFQLSIIPFAYDVSIGERYQSLQPNDYQLSDHLEVDPKTLTGDERLAFKSADYKRLKNLINSSYA